MMPWYANWLVSLPLILLSVLIHSLGLGIIRVRSVRMHQRMAGRRDAGFLLALTMAALVLLVAGLHALEAEIWAIAYVALGALPDARSAMLYSLSAMTTFGHAGVYLAPEWQMMGAIESLNGLILFGMTIATLVSFVDRAPGPGGAPPAP